jgi:hypothetical protein
MNAGEELVQVGELRRVEAVELIVGYSFNLQTNDIVPEKVSNPGAGREHVFRAWRVEGAPVSPVAMRQVAPDRMELEAEGDNAEG